MISAAIVYKKVFLLIDTRSSSVYAGMLKATKLTQQSKGLPGAVVGSTTMMDGKKLFSSSLLTGRCFREEDIHRRHKTNHLISTQHRDHDGLF
jgi:hypothetical protein